MDTADGINSKLADGLGVVLTSGIYNWSLPLQITVTNQGLYSLTVPLVMFQSRGHILVPVERTVSFEFVHVASADVHITDGIIPKLAKA